MKKSTWLLATVLGVGSFITSMDAGAATVSLVNTNIMAAVNETPVEQWGFEDNSATNYIIMGSTISAAKWDDKVFTTAPSANVNSLGTSAMKLSGTTERDVTVTDSSIVGSDGGDIFLDPEYISVKEYRADGGNGLFLEDVNGVFNDVIISGGAGGEISVRQAGTSSANGGDGLTVGGSASLFATNSFILGGNGGFIDFGESASAPAIGGAGMVIDGPHRVDLNFNGTVVKGGDGGEIVKDYAGRGDSSGGSGLVIKGGAMRVTINDGTYVGGKGGTTEGVAQQDGYSMEIDASDAGATVTIFGGSFEDGILIEGKESSTLSFKNTFSDAPLVVNGDLIMREWYNGQLSDVRVDDAKFTMAMVGASAHPYVLDGSFILSNGGRASFNNGVIVKDGATLGLGYDQSTADGGLHAESGSTIISTRVRKSGKVKVGSILANNDTITLDAGTKWIILDEGRAAFTVGEMFTLATVSGTNGAILNNLQLDDVSYVGENGSAGWLGEIVSLNVSNNTAGTAVKVEAVYGEGDIDHILGVSGDLSSPFNKGMADLTLLASTGSAVYTNLTKLTSSTELARVTLTNGVVRTAQGAKASTGRQVLTTGVINSRTHSYHNYEQVGFPMATTSTGPGGWNFLRNLSDRADSSLSTDGLRTFSDRIEGAGQYDALSDSMRSAESSFSLNSFGLPESWQMWGEGYGSTEKQDTRNGVAGYDVGTGGALLGIDKRFNNLILGVAGGFSQSTVSGYARNNAKIDSLDAILYLSTYDENAYLDANVSYSRNSVDTEFVDFGYTGNYDANTLGFYVGGGYGLALNDWLVLTPEASFMATYYSRDAYEENSDMLLPTKQYDSYDQISPIGSIGATLSMIKSIDLRESQLLVQPELRFHLMHDFNAEMDPETYTFQGGTQNIEAAMVSSEENLIKIGAGLRMSKWSSTSTEFGVDVDGLFADGYNAFMVSGRIIHRF